jgi:hypothetical protein
MRQTIPSNGPGMVRCHFAMYSPLERYRFPWPEAHIRSAPPEPWGLASGNVVNDKTQHRRETCVAMANLTGRLPCA